MAFAWYTKMTSASDMIFDAARWEYSANYAVDSFSIGVYTSPVMEEGEQTGFTAVVNGKAAPGTCGYSPVRLSAGDSDTAVGYVLKVDKSTMSTEFQERIFFYQDAAMTEPVGTDWGGDGREGNVIVGTIPPGEEETVYIYWKWAYDLTEAKTLSGKTALSTAADDAEFDTFDTAVGKDPERYEPDMRAQILITGTQLNPGEATGQWIEMNVIPEGDTDNTAPQPSD